MKKTSYFSKKNSVTSNENKIDFKLSINSGIKKNSILISKSINDTESDVPNHLLKKF